MGDVVEQVMSILTARDSDNGYQILKGYIDERDVANVIDALKSLPVEQRMEAMGMVPALSIPPIDCNEDCMDGPCTCSGKFRVRAWGEPNDPIRPVGEGVRPTGKVDLK